MMDTLLPLAEKAAALLRAKKQRIAIAESSTGGLIASSLLAMPGASDYFLGGAVVYTVKSRLVFLGLGEADLVGLRASTEAYALLAARRMRERFEADWAIGETGAAGPTGNRYGDAPGHSCIAIVGATERAATIETRQSDRIGNMRAFAAAALKLLAETLA
ncbi:MAG TPA: CinA family protein [Stellaceae bacterium]|jgi:PncC family amidohydrolase|nr:CinA family protein [Stellaceae bacterium]